MLTIQKTNFQIVLNKMEKDIDDVIDNLDDTNEELKKLFKTA